MKKNLLAHMLLALVITGYSQTTPESVSKKDCCGFKNRLGQLNKMVTDLYFDEQGRPLQPIGYVPYGSQINVIAKNVNPLKTLPSSTLTFSLFNTTRQSDVPDIAALLGVNKSKENSSTTGTSAKQADATYKKQESFSKSFITNKEAFTKAFSKQFEDADIAALNDKASNLAEAIKSRDEIKIEVANAELLQKLDNLQSKLIQKEKELDESKKETIAAKEKIAESLANIKALTEQIKRLQDQEVWAASLKIAYNKLITDIHSLAYYYSLGASVNKIFSEQFLDVTKTKTLLTRAVISHLPGAGKDKDNWQDSSQNFISTTMNSVMAQYGIIADNFRRINELPIKDSFGARSTSITVKNKDGKTAKVSIPALDVFIDREPLYKEQMEYAASKAAIFRNEKTRDSLMVYSDTLMLRILTLLNSNFEQPIKTFQANADEITVKLPYGTAEPYKFKTYCHFKVEGSTGLFVHALNTGDKYKTIKISEDSLQIIRQRKDNVLYSFGFLAHFYNYDPRRRFNVGGSIGFNIPISNQANMGFLQGVAGLSFHTTSIEKLSFTMGISIRKGQRLNTNNLNEQKGKDTYTFKNTNDIEPIYDPIAQVGVFFGLCYSLFGGGKSTDTQ